MVGPNYQTPVLLMPEVYSEEQVEEAEEIVDVDLARWWTVFNDPFLDALLADALCRNFDLRIALERVCQARSTYRVQAASVLPDIEADFQGARSRTSQSFAPLNPLEGLANPFQNFFQTGFDAIWQIDIFGGLRRAARAAHNLWEASVEDANAVRILILSEVAITYADICAFQQRKALSEEIISLDEENLYLVNVRFEAGLSNEQAVANAVAILEADRAALTEVETSIKQAIYALAVLLGTPPECLVEAFSNAHPIPVAFGKIPSGLPAELLRRRPDIRSAERQAAAATEQIGVAVAELFPKFALTGSSTTFSSNPLQGANIGFASSSLKQLFTHKSLIWGAGLIAGMPIFDFGKRWSAVEVQVYLEHQIFLNYEKTVLTALKEVESDLVAYYNEEERLLDLSHQVEANQRTFDLTADLFQAGLVDYTQVLQAEGVLVASRILLTNSQQTLTTNLIALYKALGGGWECSYMP